MIAAYFARHAVSFLMLPVFIVFAVIYYPIHEHYRQKYAGRGGALLWRGIKTFALLATLTFIAIEVGEHL